VGGVEQRLDATQYKAAVTIDMRELGRVLEVDKTSRAARIEAGAFEPALEGQLKPHGLTLRTSRKASSVRHSAVGRRPAQAVIAEG
jgi:FAD/FMN-containing dehydrogenase